MARMEILTEIFSSFGPNLYIYIGLHALEIGQKLL